MITKDEFMVELSKPLVSMKKQDIETVAQFYESIPDKQQFGVEIMIKLFEYEEVKHYWDFRLNSYDHQEITNNLRTQTHARNIMGALGALIKAACSGNAILGIDQVGKYHRSFGVKPSDFWYFEKSLFQALTDLFGDDFNLEVQSSWHKFCMILNKKIIDGISDDLVHSEKKLGEIKEESEGDFEEADRLPFLIISFIYQLIKITVTLFELVFYFVKIRLISIH